MCADYCNTSILLQKKYKYSLLLLTFLVFCNLIHRLKITIHVIVITLLYFTNKQHYFIIVILLYIFLLFLFYTLLPLLFSLCFL